MTAIREARCESHAEIRAGSHCRQFTWIPASLGESHKLPARGVAARIDANYSSFSLKLSRHRYFYMPRQISIIAAIDILERHICVGDARADASGRVT